MDLYGPALPPGYVKPEDDDDESDNKHSSNFSEELKSTKLIGPQCPSFLTEKSKDDTSKDYCVENDTAANSIGPQLPPHMRTSPSDDEEDSLDNVWGPMPIQATAEIDDLNERRAAIEKRAEAMKNKLYNKNVPVKVNEREEWMTNPDTSSKNQLGAISRCLAPSKSSSSSKDRHSHSHSSRNEKTSEELKKYNKSRRSESLLEAHTKKLKKEEKKKKSKVKEERKAFDREEMAVRHFTKSQVNSVIEKAKYLNSRFSAGNKQYL